MDERKRSIAELRLRVTEYRREMEKATEELGRFLLSRPDYLAGYENASAEYQRLLRDIDDSEMVTRRLMDGKDQLDENIRDQRLAEKSLELLRRDADEHYAAVGKIALENEYPAFDGGDVFVHRYQALVDRMAETETAIAAAEEETAMEGALARIGRSARKAVLRTSLNARLSELRHLYADYGKTYVEHAAHSDDGAFRGALEHNDGDAWDKLKKYIKDMEQQKQRLDDLKKDETTLRLGLEADTKDGNVRRTLIRLEKRLQEDQVRLKTLFEEVGARAAGFKDALVPMTLLIDMSHDAEPGTEQEVSLANQGEKTKHPSSAKRKITLKDILKVGEAAALVEKIKAFHESIETAKRQIERLEASLSLDKAEAELKGLEKELNDIDHKLKQAQQEKDLCLSKVAEKQAEIEKLTRLRAI